MFVVFVNRSVVDISLDIYSPPMMMWIVDYKLDTWLHSQDMSPYYHYYSDVILPCKESPLELAAMKHVCYQHTEMLHSVFVAAVLLLSAMIEDTEKRFTNDLMN